MGAQPHSPPPGDRGASACRAAVAAAAVALLAALAAFAPRAIAAETAAPQPETVTVRNGSLVLHGLLWRPEATGTFPAVLFNHGSGATAEPDKPATLGPVFARHGYVFLFLYRRGSGLSADAGTPAAALMEKALAEKGVEASDALELELLDEHLTDARAGLEFLRGRADVDRKRIAVAGHSFGGTLALLMAATDDDLRAAVDFAGAARSWASSDALRARLLDAVERTKAPVFFIHAENDYSLAPGVALSTVMLGLDKPRRFEVYSPVGQSMAEGHDLVYLAVEQWEGDVFAFLEEFLQP
jgi:dienelactone hydrolase